MNKKVLHRQAARRERTRSARKYEEKRPSSTKTVSEKSYANPSQGHHRRRIKRGKVQMSDDEDEEAEEEEQEESEADQGGDEGLEIEKELMED